MTMAAEMEAKKRQEAKVSEEKAAAREVEKVKRDAKWARLSATAWARLEQSGIGELRSADLEAIIRSRYTKMPQGSKKAELKEQLQALLIQEGKNQLADDAYKGSGGAGDAAAAMDVDGDVGGGANGNAAAARGAAKGGSKRKAAKAKQTGAKKKKKKKAKKKRKTKHQKDVEEQIATLGRMPPQAKTQGWALSRADLDVLVAADKRRKKAARLKIIVWREQEHYDDHNDQCDDPNCPEAGRKAPMCCCAICANTWHRECLAPTVTAEEYTAAEEWICPECVDVDLTPLLAKLNVETATWA